MVKPKQTSFMKKIFTIVLSMYSILAGAQNVGVGTSNPLNKLHVAGGLRLDTLTGVNGSGIVTHNANGVIYGLKFSGNINDVLRGDGTFGSVGSGGSPANVWMLNGNSGTNPASNFLGTTDDQPLIFKIKNIQSGLLDSLSQCAAFGFRSLANNLVDLNTNGGMRNTAFGFRSLQVNTTGQSNVAVGSSALARNTSGSFNTLSALPP